MAVRFTVTEKDEFSLVEFEIEGGVIEPKDLADVKLPQLTFTKGVVLSGRGPVWLYAYLNHILHPTPWVACFDPRLGGAVVVQSHTKKQNIGDIVKV